MRAYVVVSLLTGARTEELRALTWSRVHLAAGAAGRLIFGDRVRERTATPRPRSRERTLELPARLRGSLGSPTANCSRPSAMEATIRCRSSDLVFLHDRRHPARPRERPPSLPNGRGAAGWD